MLKKICRLKRRRESRQTSINSLPERFCHVLPFEAMSSNVVNIDPEIMGGTPVFKGTRVPVETFFDYIQGGEPLDEFLEDFPTVSREQVIELLREVKDEVLPSARAV